MIKPTLYHGIILVLICTVFSCSSARSQSKRDKHKKEYQEDLSSYRPTYDTAQSLKEETRPKADAVAVVPQNDVSKKLNAKLDTLTRKQSGSKYAQGYRILIYSGKSSKDVQAAKTKVYENLPNTNIYIDFKSPNQRVKVGDCLDRTEAYGLLGKLKKYFPNAVLIPDQVIIGR